MVPWHTVVEAVQGGLVESRSGSGRLVASLHQRADPGEDVGGSAANRRIVALNGFDQGRHGGQADSVQSGRCLFGEVSALPQCRDQRWHGLSRDHRARPRVLCVLPARRATRWADPAESLGGVPPQRFVLVLDEHGADSTVARYRDLRERAIQYGMYDFGEWEMNVLAEQLEEEGRARDAIAIYELNAEFYPSSTSIALSLGRLHEAVDEVEAAIRNYERVLELRPGHRTALERLDALRGAP